MKKFRLVGLLGLALAGSCYAGGDFGRAMIAIDASFREQQENEVRMRQAEAHELEMTRLRQENELRRLQIEAMKTQRADPGGRAEGPTAVMAAIEKHPILKRWLEEGGEQWRRAVEIDQVLRARPENANLPLEDRFAKVVRLVQAEKR